MPKMENITDLKFHSLTPERWQDFECLFGTRGACGGCWCMWYRLRRSEYEAQKGEGNKHAMRTLVESGKRPGIIAYHNDEAIAWCSFAPRDEFSVLSRSRVLKPVDASPVWSIVCFFVTKSYRKRGVMTQLLEAVIDFVESWGGKIVEGYPVEPKKSPMPDVFAYTGLVSAFRKAGFKEVARRSDTRPIMRFYITRAN